MKPSLDDTIAAIATPQGIGGVGIVRISGSQARVILSLLLSPNNGKVEDHKMSHGWLVDPLDKAGVDEVMACFMASPRSYTGEDVAEIYCHGGRAILQNVLNLVLGNGARLAEKGEFTKRAFINGRIDLSQAEAVADLVSAPTGQGAGLALNQLKGKLSQVVRELKAKLLDVLASLEAVLDFPDDVPEIDCNNVESRLAGCVEEVEKLIEGFKVGRIYREGLSTVIVGKPNVGKSSLLNALLGEERAIVTEVPGTTRDTIVEMMDVRGLPLRIVDTAGIRQPRNKVEEFGVERTAKEIDAADFVLVVLDASEKLNRRDREIVLKGKGKAGVLVMNKIDKGVKIADADVRKLSNGFRVFKTSALYGKGIRELIDGIYGLVHSKAAANLTGNDAVAINARHRECLGRAKAALRKSIEGCHKRLPADFITIDLKDAVVALGEISGELVSDEVLDEIFDRFCVGK